jgi:hypothetical protein
VGDLQDPQAAALAGALSGVEGLQAAAYARGIIVIGRGGGSSGAKVAAEILDCDVLVAWTVQSRAIVMKRLCGSSA